MKGDSPEAAHRGERSAGVETAGAALEAGLVEQTERASDAGDSLTFYGRDGRADLDRTRYDGALVQERRRRAQHPAELTEELPGRERARQERRADKDAEHAQEHADEAVHRALRVRGGREGDRNDGVREANLKPAVGDLRTGATAVVGDEHHDGRHREEGAERLLRGEEGGHDANP